MTKAEVNKTLHRMYKEIRSGNAHITIQYCKGIAGTCDSLGGDESRICLNPREDILATIIHELLHHLYPDARHRDIFRMEAQMVKKMSDQQMRNLLKVIGEAI